MSTANLTTPLNFECDFTIGGEKGNYQTSFRIADEHLTMKCTCRHSSPCWHVEYILAGKTSRIIEGDAALQRALIDKAEHTPEGRFVLRKAKRKFAGETRCRRCNSEKITKLKSSFSARFFTLLKETANHTYYCRECKWTW